MVVVEQAVAVDWCLVEATKESITQVGRYPCRELFASGLWSSLNDGVGN